MRDHVEMAKGVLLLRWCIVHEMKAYENADRWFCPMDWDCVVIDAELTFPVSSSQENPE